MDFRNISILIVEDSELNIMFFESALKRTGANILIAKNGDEAVKQVQINPEIDVILMDIKMPKKDGLSATREIKKINPNIHIIVQTAYVLDYNEMESYAAGCDYFLEKPVRLPELYEIIGELLNRN